MREEDTVSRVTMIVWSPERLPTAWLVVSVCFHVLCNLSASGPPSGSLLKALSFTFGLRMHSTINVECMSALGKVLKRLPSQEHVSIGKSTKKTAVSRRKYPRAYSKGLVEWVYRPEFFQPFGIILL